MNFDWNEPDPNELNYIIHYANKEYRTRNFKTYIVGLIIMLFLEFIPIAFTIYEASNSNNNDYIFKCIVFILIIPLSYIGICTMITLFRKNIISDIEGCKIKIQYVTVRDKRTIERDSYNSYAYTTVQYPNGTKNEYKISPNVYTKLGLGSILLAIKYQNGYGFFDEIDLLPSPNTISESN